MITELTIETTAPDNVGSVKSEGSLRYISKLLSLCYTPDPNIFLVLFFFEMICLFVYFYLFFNQISIYLLTTLDTNKDIQKR